MKEKKCFACQDNIEHGPNEGAWKVKFYKLWRGSYGKWAKWYCHECLAEDLMGYHTGGGPTGECMQKIKHKRTFLKNHKWKKELKTRDGFHE